MYTGATTKGTFYSTFANSTEMSKCKTVSLAIKSIDYRLGEKIKDSTISDVGPSYTIIYGNSLSKDLQPLEGSPVECTCIVNDTKLYYSWPNEEWTPWESFVPLLLNQKTLLSKPTSPNFQIVLNSSGSSYYIYSYTISFYGTK